MLMILSLQRQNIYAGAAASERFSFVSSSLGLIGHHNHAERLVCLERRHFEIIVLAVRHTATKDANVSPSQGGLNTVHQLRLQEARENLVDWSSHLEFEVEVEAFRGAALTCEHGGPIKCGPLSARLAPRGH